MKKQILDKRLKRLFKLLGLIEYRYFYNLSDDPCWIEIKEIVKNLEVNKVESVTE